MNRFVHLAQAIRSQEAAAVMHKNAEYALTELVNGDYGSYVRGCLIRTAKRCQVGQSAWYDAATNALTIADGSVPPTAYQHEITEYLDRRTW